MSTNSNWLTFASQNIVLDMNKIYVALLICVLSVFPALAGGGGPVGEHVVMLGDSNTWIGGDDCSKPRGWNYWFLKEYAPESCRSYARSGATWTNTGRTKANPSENIGVIGDDNVIYNQIVRLAQDVSAGIQPVPTLIFISAGANDAWFSKKRPRALESLTDAFSSDSVMAVRKPSEVVRLGEAVGFCCALLRKSYPDAKIVLLTPFHMKSVPQSRITRAGNIIERSGKELGVDVIRQDEGSGIDGRVTSPATTYDGNHTNEYGARMLARYIIEQYNLINNER